MGCGASTSEGKNEKPREATAASNNKPATALPQKEVKAGGITKAQFILEHGDQKQVTEIYTIDRKKLGEGSYGSVSRATNKYTGVTCAVKSISKSGLKNIERFKQEIAIMKMMDHPNIIKLYESFEDRNCIYLCMELCTGGELFDRIIDAGHFSETQAAIVMQHIFRGIYYMHEQHVCHRDLKPENFLFVSKEPIDRTTLKIIDFGLACSFGPNITLTTKAGTPYYVAPQVLSGKYDHTSDLWSCGVIMYVLLCGYPPFYGDTDADVLSKVRLGHFTFKAVDWKNVSEDAKSLIKGLLKMNQKERCTAEQALNDVWVVKKAPRATNANLQQGVLDNLKGFRSQNKLKKAALQVIASQMNEEQIKALRETFMALDSDGDGQLTANELKEGMSKSGITEMPADLQAIIESIDSDGSGQIDYTEFLAATLDRRVYHQENVCWAAFRVFDRNGDGKISRQELQEVLGDGDVQSVAMKDLAKIMEEIDKNGDGEIDFQEFMEMMRGNR